MKYIKELIPAGQDITYPIQGRVFLIDTIEGAGSTVNVKLLKNGSVIHSIAKRKPAFKVIADYDAVIMSSDVAVTVGFFLSYEDVQIGTSDMRINNTTGDPVNVLFAGTVAPVVGEMTVKNVAGQPVPTYFPVVPTVNIGTLPAVSFAAAQSVNIGTLPAVSFAAAQSVNIGTLPAVGFVAGSEVVTSPKALQTNTTLAQATVGTVAASVIADVAAKRVIFRNAGTVNIYLGGSTVTAANAAIVLGAGDTFIDTMGAAATWYAIADAAGQKLNMQVLK